MIPVFSTSGSTYYTLRYNGDVLDSATKIDSWIQQHPRYQEFPSYCFFNQSANAGLVNGVTLTGQTSGAVIHVGRVVLTGGAVASAGMGVLIFKAISGEVVSGENLRVGATTYCVAASARLDCPSGPARSLYIMVETNNIRYALGGATPTNSAATPADFGGLVPASSNLSISGTKDVSDFQIIHAASGSNAAVTVFVIF